MEIIISALIGGLVGFFTAIIMMGAKVADQNDKLFREEVERRINEEREYAKLMQDAHRQAEVRGRRKAAKTSSKDTEQI